MATFGRAELTAKRGALQPATHWAIDDSVLLKNNKVLVDLRQVDRIALGTITHRGVSTERMTFSGSGTSESLSFMTGWGGKDLEAFEAFRREILIRFEHYRPDGRVDPAGDRQARALKLLIGLALMGGGVLVVFFSVVGLDNGSQFAAMSDLTRAVLATFLLGAGAMRLLGPASQPQPVGDYVEAMVPSGRQNTTTKRFGHDTRTIVALWVGIAAIVFAAVFFGGGLLGAG